MENPRKVAQQIKPVIIPILVFAFLYLIMCPFAQSLLPGTGSQVVITPKQSFKNYKQHEEQAQPHLSIVPLNHTSNAFSDKTIIKTPTIYQPSFSLTTISTTRLII